jgi:tetratricopeptide (TPR) repeat protein
MSTDEASRSKRSTGNPTRRRSGGSRLKSVDSRPAAGRIGNPSSPLRGLPALRRYTLLYGCVIVFLVVSATSIMNAWRRTELREAYLPELRILAQQSPKDGDVLALLGGRLAQAHEAQAFAVLSAATKYGNNDPLVWQTKAWVAAEMGDAPAAMSALHDGVKATNGNAPGLLSAIAAVSNLGPQTNADTFAAAISPEGPQPLVDAYTRGSLLNGIVERWGREHPQRSGFTTRELWAQEQPNDSQAVGLWGLALLENERAPEAVAVLRAANSLAPRSEAIQLALGQALQAEDDNSAASDEFLDVLVVDPNSVDGLIGLGYTNLATGRLSVAMAAMRRATRFAPQSADAWIGLGRASNVVAEQLAAFQKAQAIAPDRGDFTDDYAGALIKDGEYSKAEDLVRTRLSGNAGDATAHTLLAQALLLDDPAPDNLAISAAQATTALKIRPGSAVAEAVLGKTLLQERRPLEAIPELQAASSADPTDFPTEHVLIQAYREAGESTQALREAQKDAVDEELHNRVTDALAKISRQFLNLGYHRELLADYLQLGNTRQAAQERSLINELSTDPQPIIQATASYHVRLQKALGSDPTKQVP